MKLSLKVVRTEHNYQKVERLLALHHGKNIVHTALAAPLPGVGVSDGAAVLAFLDNRLVIAQQVLKYHGPSCVFVIAASVRGVISPGVRVAKAYDSFLHLLLH